MADVQTQNRYSYSGSDVQAFTYISGMPEQIRRIDSLHTISWSIHEGKGQARALGYRSIRGLARGVRCIPADQKVLIKDKGYLCIQDVEPNDYVQSTDRDYNKVVGVFKQGVKFCYQLNLQNGYSLKASYDHPVYTQRGWVCISDLDASIDTIKVVACAPANDNAYPIPDDLLSLIALLIGDGSTQIYPKSHGKSFEYRIRLSIANSELHSIGDLSQRILLKYKIPFRDYPHKKGAVTDRAISVCLDHYAKTDWRTRRYNELHRWLLRLDMYGKYSHQKVIPQEFLANLNRKQIAIFLSSLFATDGCYTHSGDRWRAQYCSTSETLVDGIQLLLKKLGINSAKRFYKKVGKSGGRQSIVSRHNAYLIDITGIDLIRFIKRIGIFGKDDKILPELDSLKAKIKNKFLDISTRDFFGLVNDKIKACNLNRSYFKHHYQISSYNHVKGITPRKALAIAASINDVSFSNFVHEAVEDLIDKIDDYIYVPINTIEPIGELLVYDLAVEERHFFICNFMMVHNTVAGSMILTVIDDNPLRPFIDNYNAMRSRNLPELGWSNDIDLNGTGTANDLFDFSNRLGTMLPPFNILLRFVTEVPQFSSIVASGSTPSTKQYATGAALMLASVELIDEGGVVSVQDTVTEITVSFIAVDMKPLALNDFAVSTPVASLSTTGSREQKLQQTLDANSPQGTTSAITSAQTNEQNVQDASIVVGG